ncbi:hypothetical protein QYF61_024336 [Mycteria americana]|uniref:Reverse transcriptase domain-containing protein n=1 Tax=Mycteria americana TaxID=33587 RepID=A0AAN7N9K3_MYCAM|nr:hypothetical protein QYF61_024336 [Mycteria americana]
MKDKKVILNSQHGFTKGKSCFTNLINFYDEATGLVDEGRDVYLDFWFCYIGSLNYQISC